MCGNDPECAELNALLELLASPRGGIDNDVTKEGLRPRGSHHSTCVVTDLSYAILAPSSLLADPLPHMVTSLNTLLEFGGLKVCFWRKRMTIKRT